MTQSNHVFLLYSMVQLW